ncbi:hypothetical protein [Microlunatus ginsengisoli]|uniref:Uncharacterized protein n=1 Tax=Microlunatus ginsengisoli TaxID=363863 RepID=A0ABP7AKY0_9ACTN
MSAVPNPEPAGTPDPAEDIDPAAAGSAPLDHPLLATITGWLGAIILGEEAAALLRRADAGDVPDVDAPETVLSAGQVWIWRESRIDVGRKSRAGGGRTYRMPVRVRWGGGHLRLDRPGSGDPRAWSARGMGWSLAGHTDLTAPPSGLTQAGDPSLEPLPGAPRETLTRLAETGRAARWEFLLWLQPTVNSALRKAHAGIRGEMGTDTRPAPPLVDQVKLEQLADLMLFGDGETASSADRLIALCCAPDTFLRVDPLRYLTTAVRRDAATVLRRAVGDPHIGRKVRQVARELGTTDVARVVAAYRRRWPEDHLAAERAQQALSVGADPMAAWVRVEG